ncbi:MAG: pantoate--beta-alanine ligase [Planctomycetia bacterium]|nr:pantoate--beta-alanine ligase [Planctomycetia bacterium]
MPAPEGPGSGGWGVTKPVATVEAVRAEVHSAKSLGKIVGLVPTMGALHEGHARLVECCRAEAGFVVVSVFVNPTQFGPTEDFARYPRTLDDDLRRCESAGADLVFAPDAATMYPRDQDAMAYVEVPGLSGVLEGAVRPGHFRGVTTVVMKLFAITQPHVAFFGAKDFQQQLLIRRMVDDLNVPVAVRTVETVREPDGLALSSRNRYLNPAQRGAASVLYRALSKAREAVTGGERDANRVRQILTATIESMQGARLDYAEVADADSLEPLAELTPGRRAVGLLAVCFGPTRLIDNMVLTD